MDTGEVEKKQTFHCCDGNDGRCRWRRQTNNQQKFPYGKKKQKENWAKSKAERRKNLKSSFWCDGVEGRGNGLVVVATNCLIFPTPSVHCCRRPQSPRQNDRNVFARNNFLIFFFSLYFRSEHVVCCHHIVVVVRCSVVVSVDKEIYFRTIFTVSLFWLRLRVRRTNVVSANKQQKMILAKAKRLSSR